MLLSIVQQAGIDLRYAGEALFFAGVVWGIVKWLKRTLFEIADPAGESAPMTLGEYPAQPGWKPKRRPTPPAPRAPPRNVAPLTPADWTRLGITPDQLAVMSPRELDFFLASVTLSRASTPDEAAVDGPGDDTAKPGAGRPPLR